ncbi:hypothetical protein V498_02181 [Pseudogymnoascus sp. VKM F-4517 (FW-2822)]|nr:hypothetical protein V498_02181 [Pseudogymnoascus sp. VKM F-4517 (FW-2822)]
MAPTKPTPKVANTRTAHRAPPKSGVQKISDTALKTAEARAKRRAEIATKIKESNTNLAEIVTFNTKLKAKLQELVRLYDNGASPQFKKELDALEIEVNTSNKVVTGYQTTLKKAIEEKDEFDKMDVDTASLFLEEGENDSDGASSSSDPAQGEQQAPAGDTPVTGDTHLGADVDSPPPSSPTPLKQEPAEAGTTDFGRWTPAEEDENNLITPQQARAAAGIATDGTIVAWAKTGFSKPVIVRYGPRNARKYMRSTAFRESDFLDESQTPKFGPKYRKGDEKDEDGQLIRKSHEFKGMVAVAFNCPVAELAPKVKIKKEKDGPPSPPSPRYPRTEVLVRWEIAGEVHECWEVRSSIKHLFSSFCDQYIYQVALLGEKQYNAWKAGERKSEDRSPTPAPRPWGSVPPPTWESFPPPTANQTVDLTSVAEPAQKVQFKIEERADIPPATTTLSPMKRFQASWCELNDVDPQNMDQDAKAQFLISWDLIKLKI